MRKNEEKLFKKALIFSVLFHSLFLASIHLKNIFIGDGKLSQTIEIDLTKPFHVGGNPLLKPGGGTTLQIPKIEGKPSVSEIFSEKKMTPKEWLLPGKESQETEKREIETGPNVEKNKTGAEEGEGFYGTGGGQGGGEGQGGGIPLSRFPKLLNRREILKLLKKHYPSQERSLGTEGVVVVDLHLGVEGNVLGVEVIESAGLSFDEVAKTVSTKMRFSPAMLQDKPIAVKIRQSIIFQIEGY